MTKINKGYSQEGLRNVFSFSADLINFYEKNLGDKEEPKKIVSRLVESFPVYEKWIRANLEILI